MAAFTGSDAHDIHKTAGIEKNLSDLGECVRSLKISFDDTGIPVDDDNVTFHRLCHKLEFLLTVGLRESSGVFSRTRSTWHYINACLAKTRKVHDGIRFVRGVQELKTPAGKLRSFLRFCLVHQCLGDTIQQCLLQEDITAGYYRAGSLLLRKGLTTSFVATLYELSDVQYDLAPTGYDLDVGWPTFARKQFGSYNWKFASSSRLSHGGGSRSSLAFSFTQDSQSVSSFQSGLTSPVSPIVMAGAGGGGPSGNNVFNSTMASTVSTSSRSVSPDREMDSLLATIRQLTEDKEELAGRLDSLAQQLDQEKENGRNAQLRMEAEKKELEEQLAARESAHSAQQEQQVSNINLEGLRQAEALARKMLAVRDGEVALLKAQLASTEAKLDAVKERSALQKTLVMEEVRKMANQLAETEHLVGKWKELASRWAELDHAEDVRTDVEGAEPLKARLKHLLDDRKATAKELDALKEANMSLVKALAQHGNRLSNVSHQLDQTWAWLSKIKLEASRLQTDESVMRYELKEKRALLDGLKEQLEGSRKQWEKIRASNEVNQSQWQSIRDELDGRKAEEEMPRAPPPIDLVSDIPPSAVDGREERLRMMEQQCKALYAKLANTTTRNAQLVGRLASLHQHHSSSGSSKGEEEESRPAEDESAQAEEGVLDQRAETENLMADKERELAAVRQELQAVKFDQATLQLEQERSQQAYQRQQEELTAALDRLKESEELIRSLQEQLTRLSGRNREDKQSMDAQLRQLELGLMTRNEECEGLVNELRSTVAELDQLRSHVKELDESLQESRASESRLKMDNQLLKDESLMLRNKIVELIKEKDCLWQRSDKLLHLHRVQATDQWLADGTIRECQRCQTRFTLFVRRHHCRLCGRIFCHSCSDHWLSIAASSRPERTCIECFSIHTQFSRPDAAEQLLPVATCEAEDQSSDPAGQAEAAAQESSCAGFTVIADSEIVRSLNESSPYSLSPQMPVDKTVRTAGIRPFESLLLAGQPDDSAEPAFSEAFLSPAMVYRVPLLVERPGCTLHWRFKTDPKSIAFAVVGKSEGGSLEDEEEHLDRVIVETSLHKSEEDFIEGRAVLSEPGTYFVYFDNSYSRFSANKVTFHLSLTHD